MISRWRNGTRELTDRSDASYVLASLLVRMDEGGRLDPLLEPYRIVESDKERAMWRYLTDSSLPRLSQGEAERTDQTCDEFLSQQYHLVGRKGFQKGALLMLDYIDRLPDSQEVIVCALNHRELWHNDVIFGLRFMRKMKRAIANKTSFTILESYSGSADSSPHFSIYWLVKNLQRVFDGRPFQGQASELFVAAIPGYWSGRVERDPTVRDQIISTFSTDPRIVRRDTDLCRAYLAQCAPSSQYGFLESPEGTSRFPERWSSVESSELAAADFSAIIRIPLFGVMTANEFAQLGGTADNNSIPSFLVSQDDRLANNARYFILCADDLRAALTEDSTVSGPLSSLLCRETRIPKAMVRQLVRRLVEAMPENNSLRVALVPKRAFEGIEMELVTWNDTLSFGWLQDHSESMLDSQRTVVASFDNAVTYVWSTLPKRWKNQEAIYAKLSSWLNDEDPQSYGDDEDSTGPEFPYLHM